MTHMLLCADRHYFSFTELPDFPRPLAHWECGEDGALRCFWRPGVPLLTQAECAALNAWLGVGR